MEKDWMALSQCALFAGVAPALLPALLQRLQARVQQHHKEEILVLAGYENRTIGIVLAGSIAAAKTAPDGTQVTIAQMGAGGIFGDVLCGSHAKSPVTVTALQPCRVLWLPAAALLRGGCTDCALHAQLLQNLIGLISDKYFQLSRRVDILLLKGLRAKILYYLQHEARPGPGESLLVPLTRAAWAEQLGCERSALSRELSRMVAQGVLRVQGRCFWLAAPAGNKSVPAPSSGTKM